MDRVDPPDSFTHAPGNVLPGIEMNVPVPKDQPLGFIFHLIPSKSALTALINAAWELSFFSRAFRIRSSMVLVLDDHRPAFLSLPPEPGHCLLVQFQTPCEPEPDQDWQLIQDHHIKIQPAVFPKSHQIFPIHNVNIRQFLESPPSFCHGPHHYAAGESFQVIPFLDAWYAGFFAAALASPPGPSLPQISSPDGAKGPIRSGMPEKDGETNFRATPPRFRVSFTSFISRVRSRIFHHLDVFPGVTL